MAVTEDQSGLSELGRRKTKSTPRWITCQLDELEKKHSRLSKKMIRIIIIIIIIITFILLERNRFAES